MKRCIALSVILIVIAVWLYAIPMPYGAERSCLKKAYNISQQPDYAGTVATTVFYCNRIMSSLSEVKHTGSLERIEYLNGPIKGTVLISTESRNHTYKPDVNLVIITHTAKSVPHEKVFGLILKNYSTAGYRSGKVACRPVDLIRLSPKMKGNPSKKLWIDRKTGVVLKSEDYSSTGELRSRMEFTKISYTKQDAGLIQIPPAGFSAEWTKKEGAPDSSRAEIEKAVGMKINTPGYLPAGYIPDGMKVYNCECNRGRKAAHIRYTNGLNNISVFETRNDHSCNYPNCGIDCPPKGKCKISDSHQAKVAIVSNKNRIIAVIADLPKQEIAKIAESVRE